MYYYRLGLVHYLISGFSYFKSKIRVFTVCRCISFIKSAYTFPQVSPYHNGSTGYVVHFFYIIIFALIGIVHSSVVPSRSVTPDYTSGFLQSAVGIYELGAYHSYAFITFYKLYKRA